MESKIPSLSTFPILLSAPSGTKPADPSLPSADQEALTEWKNAVENDPEASYLPVSKKFDLGKVLLTYLRIGEGKVPQIPHPFLNFSR